MTQIVKIKIPDHWLKTCVVQQTEGSGTLIDIKATAIDTLGSMHILRDQLLPNFGPPPLPRNQDNHGPHPSLK